ncbi:hypothetical protein LEP1GSC165_2990 [Leptospira santarosai str. CBC523]|nr:hypothetical protein LEP1GSC165_2990 [Leptospira santarosai str. CBC523]
MGGRSPHCKLIVQISQLRWEPKATLRCLLTISLLLALD